MRLQPPRRRPRRPGPPIVGILALTFAFAALGFAVLPSYLVRTDEAAPTTTIAGREITDVPEHPFAAIAMTAGLVGLGLATIAWVRREDQRLAGAAAGMALLALAWSYLLIVIIVLAVLLIAFFLLGGLG